MLVRHGSTMTVEDVVLFGMPDVPDGRLAVLEKLRHRLGHDIAGKVVPVMRENHRAEWETFGYHRR